jgi:hypothetical protein
MGTERVITVTALGMALAACSNNSDPVGNVAAGPATGDAAKIQAVDRGRAHKGRSVYLLDPDLARGAPGRRSPGRSRRQDRPMHTGRPPPPPTAPQADPNDWGPRMTGYA